MDDPRRHSIVSWTNLPHGQAMGSTPRNVLVWDIFIRIFHWLIVALIAAAYATWRLNWMTWHGWIGEAVLALVLFRLLWGCLGGETARFSSFIASPRTVSQHLKDWLRREPDHQVGHNPAGGWMVVLLLALLLVETLTGIYVANDIADEGPLTEIVPAWAANAIESSHAIIWDVLLAAIILHVLAIAAFAAIKGQNLLRPMVTGTKVLPANVATPQAGNPAIAGLLLLACAAATALLANLM
ncbi:MAG: cytochrome b/b6 domain-containing protein [Hyphomicrobiales bacterium]|nr:cytochrome b/b6 domain-containing protein [Hyphomicrobiales bacterium]